MTFAKTASQDRLIAAYQRVRDDLLAERNDGHWIGQLSTSALSTATAVSALAVVERHDATTPTGHFVSEMRESFLSELIVGGINWLAEHQNEDGGWGDTDKSHSNIATTMLAVAAFHLTGVPVKYADSLQRAEQYIAANGGVKGLRRRYGKDKTFAVPILTNYALAELIPWRKVPQLPFELACFPQSWFRFLRLPVVSYAIPALVAIGQCRFVHRPPVNPIMRAIRRRCTEKSLAVIHQMQPASGGYLEAIPLTSFVVMSLASSGRVQHPVVQSGLEFIVESVLEDGSWPIDTDLATWNTTLAVNALAGAGEDVMQLNCLDWLLSCQHLQEHPFTGAEPGGWGWSDLSGAVPDADDTPGALLALDHLRRSPSCKTQTQQRIGKSARRGIQWLLDLQNADGGWPTFCRGWGKLPFDRSGADLTAHAMRALLVWQDDVDDERIEKAQHSGLGYLLRQQRADGSWVPLWFGNQDQPDEENPVYGTSKVLLALRDLAAAPGISPVALEPALHRGVQWLVQHQNKDGGWGGGRVAATRDRMRKPVVEMRSSVEETALAVEALLSAIQRSDPSARERNAAALTLSTAEFTSSAETQAPAMAAAQRGLWWLIDATEENRHKVASPIGFYFAKLWYYEKLYPLTFTVSALGQAVRQFVPPAKRTPALALQR